MKTKLNYSRKNWPDYKPFSCSIKMVILTILTCVFFVFTGTCTDLSTKKILIVADHERLSDPVISKVMNMLRDKGAAVDVTSKIYLKNAEAFEFDAVLIVNPLRLGKASHGAKIFAGETVQRKIILFNTVNDKYWLTKNDKLGKGTDESWKIATSIFKQLISVIEKTSTR